MQGTRVHNCNSSPLLGLRVSREPVGGSAGFSRAGNASIVEALTSGCIKESRASGDGGCGDLLFSIAATWAYNVGSLRSHLVAQPQGPLENVQVLVPLALEGHHDGGQGRRAVHLLEADPLNAQRHAFQDRALACH